MGKNICLVTAATSVNFGTCVQSYALAVYLADKGFNVKIPSTHRFYYGCRHPFATAYNITGKLKLKVTKRKSLGNTRVKLSNEILNGYSRRIEKNTDFMNSTNLIFSPKSRSDYYSMVKNSDVFISGSDQIWNPYYVQPPFVLAMAGKDKTKLAYGSSIGVSHIPKKKRRFYKKYLSEYNAIGVREKTAATLLADLLDRNIQVVLDPSFLLDKNRWNLAISTQVKDSAVLQSGSYIFCYFIGEKSDWEKDVQLYAEKTGYPVFCALSESKRIPGVGKPLADLGVAEFISYIMNAKCVVTDSFHAMALSLNFNTKFVGYKRFDDTDIRSQNSRIYDLLNTFGMESRLVDDYQDNAMDIYMSEIDFSESNAEIENKRKSSEAFLLSAIKGE